MSRHHPYEDLPIPGDAPFQLKPSPGKGWGAFAKTQISEGAKIHEEYPLLVVPKPLSQVTESDIGTIVLRLEPREKFIFLCLRKKGNATDKYTRFREALYDNYFSHDHSDVSSHLYPLHSRFNHSCIPNMRVFHERDKLMSCAIRDISAGEEITFSYDVDLEYKTSQEREHEIRIIGFRCDCRACVPANPLRKASDLRRRLLRGLCFLRTGEDLGKNKYYTSIPPPLILDAQLKRGAEQHSIPLCLRFISLLMTACLLKEEGLLDYRRVEDIQERILNIVNNLGTPENREIARRAMKQASWFARFYQACKLYGRVDANDLSSSPWPRWV